MMARLSFAMAFWLALAAGCERTERAYIDEAVRGRVLGQGAECTRWFYDGRYEDLTRRFRGSLADSLGVEQLRAMREALAANYGPEVEVLEQGVGDLGALRIYRRVVRFERQPATVEVQWTLDETGDIHGFYLRPATTPPPAP